METLVIFYSKYIYKKSEEQKRKPELRDGSRRGVPDGETSGSRQGEGRPQAPDRRKGGVLTADGFSVTVSPL